MQKLIMISGLQGTGKTTLARHLAQILKYPLFTKDLFETTLYNDKLTDGHSLTAYHLLLETTASQLSFGISVIVEAVFPMSGFRQQVCDMAIEHSVDLRIIHTYCSNKALHRHRVETRLSKVPWDRITWEDVLYTTSFFEVWKHNEALFLDAVNPLETNLYKALQYIDNSP